MDIIIKEHLCCKEINSTVYLLFQITDIILFMFLLHMSFRITCCTNTEIPMFLDFLYRIREAGITVPVLPGIMPITSAAQMKRSQELSGTVFPRRFLAILDRFGSSPDAMKQAGIVYATDQIIDLLANGVNNIHIYSMNKPEIAVAIMNNLSEIIKC